MRLQVVWRIMVVLMAAFLVAGCGSDDEDSTPTGSQGPGITNPSLRTVEVPSSMQNSSNPYVQSAASMMGNANAFTAYNDYFDYNNWPEYDGEWNWASKQRQRGMAAVDSVAYYWSEGSLTYIWAFVETALEYRWYIVQEYNQQRWKMIEAQEYKSGTGGHWALFDQGGTETFRIEWTYIGGTYTLDYIGEDFLLEIIVYADGSGSMEYHENEVLRWLLTWNAAGTNGTWAVYDEDGDLIESGTTWNGFYMP